MLQDDVKNHKQITDHLPTTKLSNYYQLSLIHKRGVSHV